MLGYRNYGLLLLKSPELSACQNVARMLCVLSAAMPPPENPVIQGTEQNPNFSLLPEMFAFLISAFLVL